MPWYDVVQRYLHRDRSHRGVVSGGRRVGKMLLSIDEGVCVLEIGCTVTRL
jgi:hypothetical protein